LSCGVIVKAYFLDLRETFFDLLAKDKVRFFIEETLGVASNIFEVAEALDVFSIERTIPPTNVMQGVNYKKAQKLLRKIPISLSKKWVRSLE